MNPLCVRVSSLQKILIREAAADSQLTVSEWIRKTLLAAATAQLTRGPQKSV